MGWEFQKPFSIEEIKQHPFAVVIAFLIGFVLILGTVVGVLWYRNNAADDKCDEEKQKLNTQIFHYQEERIGIYKDLLFYKLKSQQGGADSILKMKTEDDVQKIFRDAKR